MTEQLPDFGPPEELRDPPGMGGETNLLPSIGAPAGRGPVDDEFQSMADNNAAAANAGKYEELESVENEADRQNFNSQWRKEALAAMRQVGSDVADDFYELQDLRAAMESNRATLSDHGL